MRFTISNSVAHVDVDSARVMDEQVVIYVRGEAVHRCSMFDALNLTTALRDVMSAVSMAEETK